MSGGGKSQTSKSKVTIPPEVMAQYRKATDMASAAADRPWQAYSTDPNAFVAGMTPTQMAGMENINANAQAAQPWFQQAQGATTQGMGAADLGDLNVDQYMSPYLRNVAQTTSDLLGQQNEQAMSGQLGNAITSGAAWGDRSGIAAANLNRQQMMGSANILSNLLNQGFMQAQGVAQQQQGADLAARQANLARLMQGGLNLGQLGSAAQTAALQGGQAQMEAGRAQQQTDQAKLSALYNQWLQQQAYPFQTAQFFANIAEGIGSNSGSTTSLTQPAGFFSGLARGGRAGKAAGGGLGEASMGGHVGTEHALEGFADGGAPDDYSAMVLQGLFGGGDPNAGAYGMAGGLPGGGAGFVPKPNMQVSGLKPAEIPQPADQTSAKDVMNTVQQGADLYNSDGGQKAASFLKDLFSKPASAAGGRIGYGLGGSPYENSVSDPTTSVPQPGLGYVPPPMEDLNKGSKKPGSEIPTQQGSSGLGKIADIAKTAAAIIPFFLKDGGVAGPRHGYDAGGAPGQSWGDWLEGFLPLNGPAAGAIPDWQRQKIQDAKTTAVYNQMRDSHAPTPSDMPSVAPAGGGADIIATGLDAPSAPTPPGGVPAAGGTYDGIDMGFQPGPADSGYDPISNATVSGLVNPWRRGLGMDQLPLTKPPREPGQWTGQSVDPNARPAPGLEPAATGPQDMTEFLNEVQKQGRGEVKDIWEHAWKPDTSRARSVMDMGAAGLAGLGDVVLPGLVNYAFGDPTKANPILGPEDPAAPTAPAPAEPSIGGVGSAAVAPAEQRKFPQVYGEAGMSYAPPLPKSGLAAVEPAAAAPAAVPVEKGLAPPPVPKLRPEVSPSQDRPGTSISGKERFQITALKNEGTAYNPRDPNGGTVAGFNLAQYQAVNPRIRSLADVQQHDILDAQAQWWRHVNGDAVEAKYGPEFAAAYANLSMLGEGRAASALAQAGGDPARFFDIIGGKLASLGENPKYAPNVKGWLNRVEENKQLALTGAPVGPSAADTAVAAAGAPRAGKAGGLNIQPADYEIPGAGAGGAGGGGAGQWLKENGKDLILPLLSGIGAMASSPSRYLGSAILQGLGAGANTYMKRQSQLADIAQTQAVTRGVDIANVKSSYQVLPNGAAVMWTLQGGQAVPMNAADFFRAQKEGKAIQTLGYIPGQTTGEQPGAGGAPGGITTVDTPQISMPTGINFGDKSRAAAENETAIANPLAGGQAYDLAKKQAETYTTGVQAKAETARGVEQLTNEMATNLANAILGDGTILSTPGAGFDVRAQAAKALNTALHMFKVPVEDVSNADSVSAINQKVTTLFGAMRAAGVDQTSFSAFSELASAIPNPNMPPQAIASLVASMLVQNERAKAQEYHQRQYGLYSNGLYGGAYASFNDENPVSNDIQAKDTIAKFMIEKPEMFKQALEGRINPQQLDEAFEKAYGVQGISRFFNRGM